MLVVIDWFSVKVKNTITSLIESYLSECLAGIKNNEHGKHGPCTVRSDIPEQGKWFINT